MKVPVSGIEFVGAGDEDIDRRSETIAWEIFIRAEQYRDETVHKELKTTDNHRRDIENAIYKETHGDFCWRSVNDKLIDCDWQKTNKTPWGGRRRPQIYQTPIEFNKWYKWWHYEDTQHDYVKDKGQGDNTQLLAIFNADAKVEAEKIRVGPEKIAVSQRGNPEKCRDTELCEVKEVSEPGEFREWVWDGK